MANYIATNGTTDPGLDLVTTHNIGIGTTNPGATLQISEPILGYKLVTSTATLDTVNKSLVYCVNSGLQSGYLVKLPSGAGGSNEIRTVATVSNNSFTITKKATNDFSSQQIYFVAPQNSFQLSSSYIVAAKPTGDADIDTANIKAAIAAITNNPQSSSPTGGTVYLQAGGYKVNETVSLPQSMSLIGAGADTTLIIPEIPIKTGVISFTNNDKTSATITPASSSLVPVVGDYIKLIRAENGAIEPFECRCKIEGVSGSGPTYTITLAYPYAGSTATDLPYTTVVPVFAINNRRVSVSNLGIYNALDNIKRIEEMAYIGIDNYRAHHCTYDNLNISGMYVGIYISWECSIIKNALISECRTGIHLGSITDRVNDWANIVTVMGGNVRNCYEYGIRMVYGIVNVVYGTTIEAGRGPNFVAGVSLEDFFGDDGLGQNQINGCYLEGNSKTQIKISSKGNKITGNFINPLNAGYISKISCKDDAFVEDMHIVNYGQFPSPYIGTFTANFRVKVTEKDAAGTYYFKCSYDDMDWTDDTYVCHSDPQDAVELKTAGDSDTGIKIYFDNISESLIGKEWSFVACAKSESIIYGHGYDGANDGNIVFSNSQSDKWGTWYYQDSLQSQLTIGAAPAPVVNQDFKRENLIIKSSAFDQVFDGDANGVLVNDFTPYASTSEGDGFSEEFTDSNYLYIGYGTPFTRWLLNLKDDNSALDDLLKLEYSTGSSWVDFYQANISNWFIDQTTLPLGQKVISYLKPWNGTNLWKQQTVNNATLYWVRFSLKTSTTSPFTANISQIVPDINDRLAIYAQPNDSAPALAVSKTGDVTVSGNLNIGVGQAYIQPHSGERISICSADPATNYIKVEIGSGWKGDSFRGAFVGPIDCGSEIFPYYICNGTGGNTHIISGIGEDNFNTLVVTSSNNVGIGTSSPGSKLHVLGKITANNATNGASINIPVGNSTTLGNTSGDMWLYKSGNTCKLYANFGGTIKSVTFS